MRSVFPCDKMACVDNAKELVVKQMKRRKRIFLVLAIIWMLVISAFSSRTGDLSATDSGRIGRLIGQVLVPGFEDWSEEKQNQFAEKVDYPVRKTAHATEYAILGMLLVGAYTDKEKGRFVRLLIPWFIGTIYAATDEIHQLFVVGRTGRFTDVLIDTCGSFTGIMLSYIIGRVGSGRKDGRKKEK